MVNIFIYILFVMLANIFARTFIPFPVFGQVAVGTLFFGVTFTQRDRVHYLGRKYVYGMILVTILLSILESLFLGVPWRIIIASAIAMLVSESLDTEVYQRLLKRSWALRVLASNSVSVPVDTIFFTMLAFYGVFDTYTLMSIIAGEIIVKYVVAGLTAIYKTRREKVVTT